MTRPRRRPLAVALPLALTLGLAVCRPARAQANAEERALADVRFSEGRALLDKQRYDEACAKFEESERLWPRGGTALNLAACREKQGKLASAWAAYTRALGLARKEARADREELAKTKIAALQGELSWLVIQVPPALDVEGVVVTRDGVPVGRGAWGVPVPVDPGRHVVVAKVPDQPPIEAAVDVGPRADHRAVTLAAGAAPHVQPRGDPLSPPPPAAPPLAELGMPGVVRVHVDATRPGVRLFASPGTGVLAHPVCDAPCDVLVDGRDGQLFYFDGEGMTRSTSFYFSDKRGQVVARVSPGSSVEAGLGGLLRAIGVAGVVTGGVLAVVGFTSHDALTGQTNTGLGAAGLATLGAGGATLAAGFLLSAAGRTQVDLFDEKARPLKTSLGPGGLIVAF